VSGGQSWMQTEQRSELLTGDVWVSYTRTLCDRAVPPRLAIEGAMRSDGHCQADHTHQQFFHFKKFLKTDFRARKISRQ
jgi:hypothetical protein